MFMRRAISRAVFALFLSGLAPLSVAAEPAPRPARNPRTLVEITRPLRYQSPTDAVLLLRPALSPVGSVEVQGKRVVVKDVPGIVTRLESMLDDFDHPRVDLRVVVQVVQASGSVVSPAGGNDVPEPLRGRLRKAFPYGSYRLVSQGGFEAGEGTDVRSPIGQDFPVSFRLGTLRRGQSVWLHDFQIAHLDSPDTPLLETNLVLSLDRPLVVGLTTDESSNKALLVILTCTRAAAPAVP